ncbi:FAD binding domain-containing protein [Verticillium dahliae VdLs.17]|uniref:FAD binding domain-containing protein n=1 Tax=Verticillium dahliae (strain VdLs.17 / ATCC MYA-4575 / FGSC 10137) TaxID=498257 RepID=G2XH94_VERDV|nr:FAD binding domain-containing protein [Verticillium dahliae VdLs.17]EGY19192.1 FAD binding domain-containing protein [Verticillium dahliae VdLs.17]KAH6688754.1 FAD binding domain-containing protein [Verticillium dahliae]
MAPKMIRLLIAAAAAVVPVIVGAQQDIPYQSSPVATCCSALASQFPNATFARDGSTSSAYYREKTAFWSATAWLSPSCVFLPSSTNEVSTAVSLFNDNDCPFAIRGGGHSANRGAANIDNGILVSMRNIRDVAFSADNTSVTTGMGNTWSQLYAIIEPQGYMVVGGRFATVGTGLALGAGFSYFINDKGLAVDNVVGHRVVLANGTVVETSKQSYADLFWALKGGSNNFGVVTHITLETIPTTGIYGGRVTYPESQLASLQKLTYQYQVNTSVSNRDVHVLPTYVYDGASNTTFGFSPIVYTKPASALPPSLQPWLDIPHSNSTIKNRSYYDLSSELVAGFPDGLVQVHYTFTVYPSEAYLAYILAKFSKFCSSFAHIQGLAGLHTVMPIPPRAINKAGRTNPLGLDRAKPGKSLSVFYIGVQFDLESDIDKVFPAWGVFIRTLQAEAKLQNVLFPYIMLTYADGSQQVIASYGDKNVERLQTIQRKYDPTLVFQRLVTGGHKVPLYPFT